MSQESVDKESGVKGHANEVYLFLGKVGYLVQTHIPAMNLPSNQASDSTWVYQHYSKQIYHLKRKVKLYKSEKTPEWKFLVSFTTQLCHVMYFWNLSVSGMWCLSENRHLRRWMMIRKQMELDELSEGTLFFLINRFIFIVILCNISFSGLGGLKQKNHLIIEYICKNLNYNSCWLTAWVRQSLSRGFV